MQTDTIEAVWLESDREFSLAELSELSRLPEPVLRELVDLGALAPIERSAAHWTFGASVLLAVQTAGRLRDDLDLEPQTLALALALIGRIRDLEAELCRLRAQLPQRHA